MKNKEKYNLRELLFSQGCDFSYILYNGKYIAKFERMNTYEYFNAVIDWLEQEYKEPILDEKEREYLSAVIKPWRDKVTDIIKTREWKTGKKKAEFIRIGLDDAGIVTDLPYFKAGSMYRNMELDRAYSLEDLGI